MEEEVYCEKCGEPIPWEDIDTCRLCAFEGFAPWSLRRLED